MRVACPYPQPSEQLGPVHEGHDAGEDDPAPDDGRPRDDEEVLVGRLVRVVEVHAEDAADARDDGQAEGRRGEDDLHDLRATRGGR